MRELAGKVAVVTGGGSGIGRGMALAFAEAGMHVAIGDIDRQAAQDVLREIERHGVRALALQLDVTDRDAVYAFAERIFAEFGAVHLLCNNAGVVTFDPMDKIKDEDWRWVCAVNLDGVTTASIAGVAPHTEIAPYVASKYAVVGISETLYAERDQHGIGSSVLCPGNVRTKIVSSGRNRQDALGGPDGREHPDVQRQIEAGMDPLEVGRIVRQAVLDDELYIFTHSDTRRITEERFQRILAAFDRCDERSRSTSAK